MTTATRGLEDSGIGKLEMLSTSHEEHEDHEAELHRRNGATEATESLAVRLVGVQSTPTDAMEVNANTSRTGRNWRFVFAFTSIAAGRLRRPIERPAVFVALREL